MLLMLYLLNISVIINAMVIYRYGDLLLSNFLSIKKHQFQLNKMFFFLFSKSKHV